VSSGKEMSVKYTRHSLAFQIYGDKIGFSYTRPVAGWASRRMPLLADKPDEEHIETVKLLELKKQP